MHWLKICACQVIVLFYVFTAYAQDSSGSKPADEFAWQADDGRFTFKVISLTKVDPSKMVLLVELSNTFADEIILKLDNKKEITYLFDDQGYKWTFFQSSVLSTGIQWTYFQPGQRILTRLIFSGSPDSTSDVFNFATTLYSGDNHIHPIVFDSMEADQV